MSLFGLRLLYTPLVSSPLLMCVYMTLANDTGMINNMKSWEIMVVQCVYNSTTLGHSVLFVSTKHKAAVKNHGQILRICQQSRTNTTHLSKVTDKYPSSVQVMDTYYIGRYNSNFHIIAAKVAPSVIEVVKIPKRLSLLNT